VKQKSKGKGKPLTKDKMKWMWREIWQPEKCINRQCI